MIYDCFLFYNEFDLLEIRLNELNPVVDKFVLVEATRTHQKKKKLLYYAENMDLLKLMKLFRKKCLIIKRNITA